MTNSLTNVFSGVPTIRLGDCPVEAVKAFARARAVTVSHSLRAEVSPGPFSKHQVTAQRWHGRCI